MIAFSTWWTLLFLFSSRSNILFYLVFAITSFHSKIIKLLLQKTSFFISWSAKFLWILYLISSCFRISRTININLTTLFSYFASSLCFAWKLKPVFPFVQLGFLIRIKLIQFDIWFLVIFATEKHLDSYGFHKKQSYTLSLRNDHNSRMTTSGIVPL